MEIELDVLPFPLSILPNNCYLVGGAVRDAIIKRSVKNKDFDFVILEGNAIEIAKRIARKYNGGLVVLDPERLIARVVFHRLTVDFAQAEGGTLEQDLGRRDYTINAIAYYPITKQIVDLFNGVTDLQQGIIQMISPSNLQEDPLRILRGYRQAAQLGFKIDSATQNTIYQLAPLIKKVAPERVLAELRYLLAAPNSSTWLSKACLDNLFKPWLEDEFPNLETLPLIDQVTTWMTKHFPEIAEILYTPIKSTISTTTLGLTRLYCIINPSSIETQLQKLSASNAEIKSIVTIQQNLSKLSNLITIRDLYYFFRSVQSVFPAIALLGIANGTPLDIISSLIQRYLNPNDLTAHPQPLLTGQDIMNILQIKPSPQIATILTELNIAMAEGKISTKSEAIDFCQTINHQADNR